MTTIHSIQYPKMCDSYMCFQKHPAVQFWPSPSSNHRTGSGTSSIHTATLLCLSFPFSHLSPHPPLPPPAPHWLSRLFSHLCPLCALSLSFIYSLIHSVLFSLGLGCSLFMHILSLLHHDIFVCLFGQALQKHCQRLLSKDLKSIIYVHISSLEHTHKHKHTRIHKHILVWIVGFCRTLERLHDFLSVGCWLWFFSHGLQVLN